MEKKFKIQDDQYIFPYHHLVNFDNFKSGLSMAWGIEYYGYMKKIMEIIDEKNFNSLLDAGCGEGKLIFELWKKHSNKKLVGIDLSKRAILFAKAFNYGNKASFFDSDISEINDKFDIVTAVETIEHIPDENLIKFIDNLYNKLNKNGFLIISVPSKNIPLQKKHYRHYDLDLLLKQFNKFKLSEVHYLIKKGFCYNFLIRLSRKLSNFNLLNKLSLFLAKKFLFNASEKNCRHLVAVFEKK